MKKQRLVLLFDGTWNDPEDRTNVYRLSRLIRDYDGDLRQRFFYDPGVGTSRWTRFRGGTLGYGLTRNLLQGYEWLARRHTEGSEIWIFGFSRGAYTARSLVGLIRKCGLLHIVTPKLLDDAEALYRNRDESPDGDACRHFRVNFSHQPKIHFIGVWDTVGALGVPGTFWSEKGRFAWHDTQLSSIVERAYQALALDEHRAVYDVALWTSENGEKKPANLDVEQRWFVGAHSNVGGGYADDSLPDPPLHWLVQQAAGAGLKLADFQPRAEAWKATPVDSFGAFLKGGYALFRKIRAKGDGRHFRRYSTGSTGLPAVNVTVDDSVWSRWREMDGYRPPTLVNAGLAPPDETR